MNTVSWLCISALLGAALLTGAVNERRLSHWAWQRLQDISQASKRSIDSFTQDKLKMNGLQLSPEANGRTLIRRLTHDLQKKNIPSKYIELPDGGHGLNGYKGPSWDAWQTGSIQWLKEIGILSK